MVSGEKGRVMCGEKYLKLSGKERRCHGVCVCMRACKGKRERGGGGVWMIDQDAHGRRRVACLTSLKNPKAIA
jgi:hypothetical protein